jgi:hypothetical protein
VHPYALPDGDVGLAQVVDDPGGRLVLKNQVWDGAAWQPDDNLILPETEADELYSLSASGHPDGALDVVYASRRVSSGLADEPWQVILLRRAAPGELPAQPTAAPQQPDPQTLATSQAPDAGGPPTLEILPATQTPEPAQAAATMVPAGVFTPTPTVTPPPPGLAGEEPSPVASDTVGMALAAGAAVLVAVAFFAVSKMRRDR